MLRFFAAAREAAGTGREEAEPGTVRSVLDAAVARHGSDFGAVVAQSRIWRNGEPVTGDQEIVVDGDEIAILPPVSGGAC